MQRNIEAFNGNKDKVTIFGESAGALSVDALVTTMPDNPPFRAGILQSGTTSLANFIALNNNNTANWESLLSLTDCAAAKSGLECIKAVPALTIKELITSNSLTFYPAEDEVTLSSTPLARREAGDIAQVPMFVGSNKDEGRIYSVGADNFTAFLEDLIPIAPVRDAIAEAYPVAEYGGDFEAISAMWTDLVFTCPQSIHAEAHAESGLKTWRFFYSANFTNTNPLADQGIDLGASHSLEIPLVFGTYPEEGSTTQQKELSRVMRKAWTDFAKDPNGAGPGWAAVGTGENDLGEFGRDGNEGVEIVNREVADAKCETFELIYGALAVVV